MNRLLLRAVGAATAVYGVAVAARPALLAAPSGLTAPDGTVPRAVETCLRPLGLRDAACGLAMACAPDDRSLRTATLLRIASDLGDAVLLTGTLPRRRHRAMALTVSVGWGLLSIAGLAGVGRGGEPRPPALRRSGAAGGRRYGEHPYDGHPYDGHPDDGHPDDGLPGPRADLPGGRR